MKTVPLYLLAYFGECLIEWLVCHFPRRRSVLDAAARIQKPPGSTGAARGLRTLPRIKRYPHRTASLTCITFDRQIPPAASVPPVRGLF